MVLIKGDVWFAFTVSRNVTELEVLFQPSQLSSNSFEG